MNISSIYPALFEHGAKLVRRVEPYDAGLAMELKILLDMIQNNIPKNGAAQSKKVTQINPRGKRAVPIVKSIFTANPGERYTPPEIRDILKEFKDRGELISKSGSLLSTAHSAIRVLERQGYIEKIIEPDADPVYRLKPKGTIKTY